MSTYFFPGSNGGGIGIQPVLYEVRIIRIDLLNYYYSPGSFIPSDINGTIERTTSGSLTGGSVVSPAPSRGGTQTASSICKTGSVNASGSTEVITKYNAAQISMTSITLPVDIIIPIGRALISINSISGFTMLVYFEELRTSWHN